MPKKGYCTVGDLTQLERYSPTAHEHLACGAVHCAEANEGLVLVLLCRGFLLEGNNVGSIGVGLQHLWVCQGPLGEDCHHLSIYNANLQCQVMS